MSDRDEKRRVLESSADLKGGKKKGGKKRSAWISVLSLVVILGIAVGIYFYAPMLKPSVDDAEVEVTPAPTPIRLVERLRADVDRVTVKVKGNDPFTVVYNQEPVATETPSPGTTPSPEQSAEATAEVTAAATAQTTAETTAEATAEPTPEPIDLPDYTIEGDLRFNMNQSTGSSIIGYASALSATSLVEEGVKDLERFGLKDPAIRVTMKYRDGTSFVLLFGDKVPTGSGYYVTPEGSGAVYVTYSSPYTTFNREVNSLHVLSMPVTIDAMQIKDLLIEQAGKNTVELRYADAGEVSMSITTLRLVQPFLYDAHSDRASAMLESAAALTITGYAGQLDQLPESGLDAPSARIVVTMEDGTKLNYRVGNRSESKGYYVMVDDTQAVYYASPSTLSFLQNATPEYLVDQFSNLVNIAKVDQISIRTKDDSYNIAIQRDKKLDANGNQEVNSAGLLQTIDTYFFDGQPTDEKLFKKLYQIVIGTMFSKTSSDYHWEGAPVLTVTYTLNISPGSFTIEYLEYDDEYYAIRRDGQTLFLTKHSVVENVIQQSANYREGTFVGD